MVKTKVLFVGIGGYAHLYLNETFSHYDTLDYDVVAGIDPYAEKSEWYSSFVKYDLPIFDTLNDFYQSGLQADLAVIITPIQFHADQILSCLSHGMHVLTEKPVCATINDVDKIIEMQKKTGLHVAVGYQWSHSSAIQMLKKDVLSGRYGKLKRMKSIVCWPRDFAYYTRGSGWAAKRQSANGEWILDSVAMNATAHYLHNMLYCAGSSIDRAAFTTHVDAEVYRANDIEMFDTCCLKARISTGQDLLFLVTHAIEPEMLRNPEFIFEYVHGNIHTRTVNGQINIVGETDDGQFIDYGFPNERDINKLYRMLDVINGKSQVICGPAAAREQVRVIDALAELFPETPKFPDEYIWETTERKYVPGLANVLEDCYEQFCLPSDLNIPWAQGFRSMDLSSYQQFSLS